MNFESLSLDQQKRLLGPEWVSTGFCGSRDPNIRCDDSVSQAVYCDNPVEHGKRVAEQLLPEDSSEAESMVSHTNVDALHEFTSSLFEDLIAGGG